MTVRAAVRRPRAHHFRRARDEVGRFLKLAARANITGQAHMVAYTMLLAVVPLALLGLFVAGQVLSSTAVQNSVLSDLREVFPGTTQHTLDSLLNEVRSSSTGTGLLGLLGALWLGSNFWSALDTAFARIYGCSTRPWLQQKRFAILMVLVVLLFMIATVAVPTIQSLLRAGVENLPFDLSKITPAVYGASLGVSLTLLFACLAVIYARVPNRPIPWRGVWPGAIGATVAIGVIDYAFPAYLSSISTIARFGTTIVFLLIVLGWFYLVSVILLGGAVINALRLGIRA